MTECCFHNNAHEAIGNKGGKDYNYHSMNQTPSFNYTNIVIDFVEGKFNAMRKEREKYREEKHNFFHLEVLIDITIILKFNNHKQHQKLD